MKFKEIHHSDLIVLMGMLIMQNGDVRRDLAVIPIGSMELFHAAVETLHNCTTVSLQLEPKRLELNGCRLFEQKNIKASRKQILPLLQTMLA